MAEKITAATARYVVASHSHVLRLPRRVVEALGLRHGDYVAIELLGDRFVARRITRDYVLGGAAVDARKLMRREGETES